MSQDTAQAKHWADGRTRKQLPIDDRLDDIFDLFELSQVVIVEAETGAGKTTRIPQEALLREELLGEDGKIFMSLPRRAAVRWNGRHIAREMGGNPGGKVGWRLYGEDPMTSDETQLTLLVDQSLANRIMRENRLPKGLLIIDEAHERNIATDMLLLMIKELLPQSPETKVLVTSATIDTEKFSKYFDDAPVEKIKGRCFPVSTEIRRLEYAEHHSSGAASAAKDVIDCFADDRLIVPVEDGEGDGEVKSGTVAVLLPGKEDIENICRVLEQHLYYREKEAPGISDRVEIVACSGESSPEELERAQAPVPDGKLRFVVSTEIIRSSVTIESLVGVVDSLQVKRLIVDHKGVAHLKKVAVSRAEADQAKGRAGRTRPGFYIPISFKDEYEYLQPYPEPAILREPIMRVVLQIANMGRSIRTAELIDKPDDEKIDTAIRQLKLIGCLDEEERITKEGELVVKFPTDPERTRMLITADQLGVLPEAVIVAATIEEEGFFYYPKDYDKREKADRERRELAQGNGDYVAIVNAYRLFKRAEKEIQDEIREERRSNGGKAVGNQESRMRDWCIEHNINYKRIRIVENSISQLREEINSSPLKLENGIAAEREFDPELLIKSALSGQLNDVSVYRAGARSSQFESDRGNFDLSYGSTCPRDAKLILTGGSLSKVAVKGGSTVHRLLSDTASPIKPEWLEEIFPHLCRREALGDLRYEPKTDEVWETAYLRFNGRDIATLPVRSENDELASEVLARWLAENVTMASENPLGEVLQANLVQREAARSLNIRNGSVIFPEYPSLSLAGYYKDKLNGARSIREISNPQALLLPEPDSETKELMELVRSENPETIEVCGRQKPVEYQLGHQPRVVVAFDEEADFYHQLPDDAVCLPGGRSVVFCVGSRYYSTKVESDNMQVVKNGIRFSQNCEQWTNWRDRPEIAQPDFDDEDSTIPDIAEANYGNCVLTGEPLTAYGVVAAHVSHPYYESRSTIRSETKWCQNKAEADRAHQTSVEELEKYRETRQKELEHERVENEMRELETACRGRRAKLQETTYNRYYNLLDGESRDRVSDLMNSLYYLPQDVEERRKLIAETDDLLARLPNMLAAAEKRAEQDRTDRERINQLLEVEYPCCPVCGQEWHEGRRDCECEGVLRADTGLVKASYAPDGNIVVSARIYSEYGRNYLRVEAENAHNVPELSEIRTETLYRPPKESREGDRNGADGGLPDGADSRGSNPDLDRPADKVDIAALMARFNKK